jgi:hypothetical protein
MPAWVLPVCREGTAVWLQRKEFRIPDSTKCVGR